MGKVKKANWGFDTEFKKNHTCRGRIQNHQ